MRRNELWQFGKRDTCQQRRHQCIRVGDPQRCSRCYILLRAIGVGKTPDGGGTRALANGPPVPGGVQMYSLSASA